MKNIKIRKAAKKDVKGILHLVEQMVVYHCKFDNYYKPLSKYKNLEKEIKLSLKNKDMLVLVAELEKEIVGYYAGGIEKAPSYADANKAGFLYAMIVDDKHRRKQIGKKLLRELIKWFEQKKIKHIEGEVDSRNRIGLNFWRKNGFFDYRIKIRFDL